MKTSAKDVAGTTPDMAFGAALRRARKARGITQANLAIATGYDRSYISLLENGRYSPSLNTIYRLAAAVGSRPSTLLADGEGAVDTLPDRGDAGDPA